MWLKRKISNKTVDKRLEFTNVKRAGEYIGYQTKSMFECLCCHNVWLATPANIFSNRGCPKCNLPGASEKLMHLALNKSNIEYEPQWLITKLVMEAPNYRIDAYIPSANLAIEYNGRQHYEAKGFSPSQSKEEIQNLFIKQQIRDKYVRDLCKSFNIDLLEIDGRKFYGKNFKIYLSDYLIPLIYEKIKIIDPRNFYEKT